MTGVNYLVAIAIGGLVGAGELVGRYRDAPGQALLAPSALLYIAVNAAASAAALGLIYAFGWKFGQTGTATRWIRILVAGFGSMALFRSSLFKIRAGDQDIDVGPSSFLQIILNAADGGVDRRRAKYRAKFVGKLMQDVDYEKAKVALPTYCLTLMQNLPANLQQDLSTDLAAIDNAQIDPEIKSLNLGLRLMNMVGPAVVKQAVESLGDRIKVEAAEGATKTPPGADSPVETAAAEAPAADTPAAAAPPAETPAADAPPAQTPQDGTPPPDTPPLGIPPADAPPPSA